MGDGWLTLADYPFTPEAAQDAAPAAGASGPPLSFGHVVPFVAGTRAIQIVQNSADTVIGTKAVSLNPPAISNVALQGPAESGVRSADPRMDSDRCRTGIP